MKILRLLTIGNSFAGNALTYLQDLAADTSDVCFEIGRANLGGCSLEKHWNLAEYTARHPEYRPYTLNLSGAGAADQANLQDALTALPWDYVTLQQVSRKSCQREIYQPWLGRLVDLVGCVWYQCLSGLDVRKVSFHPEEVDAQTAGFLREIAHKTCRESAIILP